jgi:transcriptional regulator
VRCYVWGAPVYVPDAFEMTDRAELFAHMMAHPFATVVTHGDDGVMVSHLPLLVDVERSVLRGHLARENPQRAHFAGGAQTLAIFHGPHGYVSPSVYAEPLSVPTWNYTVVHARGPARLVDEQALRAILDDTVARFDSTRWRLQEDPAFLARMLGAIAGFEVTLEGLEGKWKISQNRPPADVPNVIAWLDKGDDASRALARLMRERRAASQD